jgi:hypothetical protein
LFSNFLKLRDFSAFFQTKLPSPHYTVFIKPLTFKLTNITTISISLKIFLLIDRLSEVFLRMIFSDLIEELLR